MSTVRLLARAVAPALMLSALALMATTALHIEDGLPAATLDELKRRGHRMEPEPVGAYGGYQAIWRDLVTGAYAGATEKRKDGCAAGY